MTEVTDLTIQSAVQYVATASPAIDWTHSEHCADVCICDNAGNVKLAHGGFPGVPAAHFEGIVPGSIPEQVAPLVRAARAVVNAAGDMDHQPGVVAIPIPLLWALKDALR